MKKCTKCLEEKDFNCFYKKNKTLETRCKECIKKLRKMEFAENRNSILERNKNWYIKNKDKKKEYEKTYKHIRNQRKRDLYNSSIEFRILDSVRKNLGTALRRSFKNKKILKCEKTINLLGCSIEEFKKYLESKFQPGMTWENYGKYGWHIDHIIPCSAFNFLNPEDQKRCFHYTN